MPISKNPAMYTDCHAVLEQAVERGGLKLKFHTKGKAMNFRMRLNAYRKILIEAELKGKPTGYIAHTPYDHFSFSIRNEIEVHIVPREIQVAAIMDLDDNVVPIPEIDKFEKRDPETEDELLDDVANIVGEIKRTGKLTLE